MVQQLQAILRGSLNFECLQREGVELVILTLVKLTKSLGLVSREGVNRVGRSEVALYWFKH